MMKIISGNIELKAGQPNISSTSSKALISIFLACFLRIARYNERKKVHLIFVKSNIELN